MQFTENADAKHSLLNKCWLNFMWNLEYTVKKYKFWQVLFLKCMQIYIIINWSQIRPTVATFSKTTCRCLPLEGVIHNARVRGGNACERLLTAYVVGAWCKISLNVSLANNKGNKWHIGNSKKNIQIHVTEFYLLEKALNSNWKWFNQTQHNVMNKKDLTEGIEVLRGLRKICLNSQNVIK